MHKIKQDISSIVERYIQLSLKLNPLLTDTTSRCTNMFIGSKVLTSPGTLGFLFLFNTRLFSITQATLLYRGSEHGWRFSDFHQRCDGKAPTLVLMKCNNRVCGGFSTINWDATEGWLTKEHDEQAFLFSVDLRKCFYPKTYERVSPKRKYLGPAFGVNVLSLIDEPMNGEKKGVSILYEDAYMMTPDEAGRSPLTGAGKESEYRFTCTECEVYSIKY